MDVNFKKMWPCILASLVAFSGALQAADRDRDRDRDDKNMNNDGAGPDMQITPSVRPKIKGGSWTVGGAVFLWNAHEDGLGFAYTNANTDANPVTLNEAKIVNLDAKWDFGFKVGVGYNFEHDGWDARSIWTDFRNRSKKSAEEENSSILIPTYSSVETTTLLPTLTATDTEAHWKLRLDYLDLELGREFWVSKWLDFRPFIGLRGGWVKQKYEITYQGGNITDDTILDQVDMHNNFKGIGPRAGLATQWCLGGGWSLFGDIAASLMYGRFDVDYQEEQTSTVSPFSNTDLSELDDHFRGSRLFTDLSLGLRYEHFFGDRKNYLCMVSLAWENHIMSNMNNFYRVNFMPTSATSIGKYQLTREHGDLSLQGWTFCLAFDF